MRGRTGQDSGKNKVSDGWSNVPKSYVNDNGKPKLNNTDADHRDDARVAAGHEGIRLLAALKPTAYHTTGFAEARLQFQYVGLVGKL